ncbi:MAG: chloride channel protein [Myxococcota bacterium]
MNRRSQQLQEHLTATVKRGVQRALEMSNRLHLPAPSVLPAAGAVVGLYAGLAAGLFANLLGLVSGVCFRLPHLLETFAPGSGTYGAISHAFQNANWHLEYGLIGAPVALSTLLLSRVITPGGPRDLVKRRLRVLALLTLGALGLYYPMVALAALNTVFGQMHDLVHALRSLPWWAKLLAPAVGGLVVGRLLRDRPETHGHGVPEVVMAVKQERAGLPADGGILKLVASAITIGSGGSAGREGPIVYGGAAFGSAVGQVLGFSRRELSVLLACGAGAGIAASFNAPIAGAIFALEIILREFQLKVFSPIILASVTGTMVGRGVMGSSPMLARLGYQLVSGWEILGYVGLGVVCGLIAFALVRLLHHSERFFSGRFPGVLSPLLGRQPLWARAGLGGWVVGLMVLANSAVWGTGHDFVNLASVGNLSLTFLVTACALKLLGTAVTIGSGGSGGTFFPATVIGAMAGGAFGTVLHALFPTITAPSGAYAMVGMGGAVAGLTRGPLTGMMMLYELSGNYAIILPLMVTCTIASALCHALVERRAPKVVTDQELLRHTPVRALVSRVTPVKPDTRVRELVDLLLSSEEGTLPVLDVENRVYGIATLAELREVWRDEQLSRMLNAVDVARKVRPLTAELDLAFALEAMDQHDVDALPVLEDAAAVPLGIVSRAAIRRWLFRQHSAQHALGNEPVAATEL